jgi:hypothetical protein
MISVRWFFGAEMAVRYTSLAAAMIRGAEHPSRAGSAVSISFNLSL